MSRNEPTIRNRIGIVFASGLPFMQRFYLLAALYWTNSAGILYPSTETVARGMGIHVATLSRIITAMLASGVLELVGTRKGGRAGTTRLRIPMFANAIANPHDSQGFGDCKPSQPSSQTLASTLQNPRESCDKPSQSATRTIKNTCEQTNTTEPGDVVEGRECQRAELTDKQGERRPGMQHSCDTRGVFATQNASAPHAIQCGIVGQLSLSLQQHPNATPERVAWINEQAPGKNDPKAWAASAIRQGWDMPVERIPPKPVVAWTMDRFEYMTTGEQAAWTERGKRLSKSQAQWQGKSWSWIGIAMRAAIASDALHPLDESARSEILRETARRNKDARFLANTDTHFLKLVWCVLVDRGIITQDTMPPQLAPSIRLVGEEGAA